MDSRNVTRGAAMPLCCAIGLFAVTSSVEAAFINLGPAGDFNVFTLGNLTSANSDIEGRVAVGGSAQFSSYSIGNKAGASSTNLIVGGNFVNQSGSVTGNVLVGGNVNWHNPTIQGNLAVNGNATFTGGGSIVGTVDVAGTYTAPGYFHADSNNPATAFPFSFSEVADYLMAESDYLASLAATGTSTTQYGTLTLDGSNVVGSTVIFNVAAADLSAAHTLVIKAGAGVTVVVNVTGGTASMQNMGISFSGGVDRQHVVYNFADATSVTLGGIAVEGTVLAPQASVNFISGQINGSLIVGNLTGSGESHNVLFQGTLPVPPPPTPTPNAPTGSPVAPEPGTFALAAFGLAALFGRAGLRRRHEAEKSNPI
jgi:choice-of-anchor A domain-containing protein